MKPATYKRLFKKYKAAPVSGTYVSRENQNLDAFGFDCAACAVGIRIIQKYKSVKAGRNAYGERTVYSCDFRTSLAELAGMSPDFCSGLDNGWESYGLVFREPSESFKDNADYLAGFYEGKAAADACKPYMGVHEITGLKRTD